jgi:hypothetical protein
VTRLTQRGCKSRCKAHRKSPPNGNSSPTHPGTAPNRAEESTAVSVEPGPKTIWNRGWARSTTKRLASLPASVRRIRRILPNPRQRNSRATGGGITWAMIPPRRATWSRSPQAPSCMCVGTGGAGRCLGVELAPRDEGSGRRPRRHPSRAMPIRIIQLDGSVELIAEAGPDGLDTHVAKAKVGNAGPRQRTRATADTGVPQR